MAVCVGSLLVFAILRISLWCHPDQSVCYVDDEGTEDDSLREMVDLAVQRLHDALNPAI